MALLYADYEPAIQAPFQRGPWGTAWGAAFGNVKDLHLQRMKQGILARFPTFAPPDAIGQIALERQMVQGVNETLAHFVQRLLNPWGVWTEGGTYWGLLAELAAAGYDGGSNGSVYIAASNGYVYGPGDTVTVPDPVNAYDPGATYLIPETGDVVVHVNATDLYRGRSQRGPTWAQSGAVPFSAGDRPIPSFGPFGDGTVFPGNTDSNIFALSSPNPLDFAAGQSFSGTLIVQVPSDAAKLTDGPVLIASSDTTDYNYFWVFLRSDDPMVQVTLGVGTTVISEVDVSDFGSFLGATIVISFGYDGSTNTLFLKVNNRAIQTASLGGPSSPSTTSAFLGNYYDSSDSSYLPFDGQLYEFLASKEVPSDAAFTAIYDAVQANIRTIPGTPPEFTRIPPWYTFGSSPVGQEWAAHTDYAVNAIVTPIGSPGTYFVCTQGGTSGGIEPIFPGPAGSVVDGTVTWTYLGDYHGSLVYPPWNFGGADGQGAPSTLSSYSGTDAIGAGGDASPDGAFWSRFVVIFDPIPSSWSSIANPPTLTSAPGSAEISVIREIIAKLKPAKSTCVGIIGLGSGSRACWAWPLTTTTNIPNSNWMSRAISAGDVDAEYDFDAQAPQTIESWLANTTFANGLAFVYMIPSSQWENDNSPTLMLFEATGPSVTTGFVEPTWPTVIGDTVTDNGITWTAIATLYRWQDQTGVTVFTF